MKNLEQYVGRKVKGVKFTSGQYNDINFNSRMDVHIGYEGVITRYIESENAFRIAFESPEVDYWSYPAEVILPQLEGEIIGYTINDEKYAKIIAGLVGISADTLLTLTDDKVHFRVGTSTEEIVKEFDLLDKCTPVYKTVEVKLPKINGYDGEDKGDYLQYGCAKLLKSWFEKSESRSINSLELSSHVTISSRQMEEIRKYLKFNK